MQAGTRLSRLAALAALGLTTLAAGCAGGPQEGDAPREVRLPDGSPLPPGVEPAPQGEGYQARDGSLLVWVPAGRYRRGDDDLRMSRGEHQVELTRGFLLGQHEVTWDQFEAYCRETGRQPPSRDMPGGRRSVYVNAPGDHPVFGVTRAEAQAYCEWAGGRLPTEAEWEWAAAGPEGHRYPWGPQRPDGRANLGSQSQEDEGVWRRDGDERDGFYATAPVGAVEGDRSWVGAADLAGNVQEWVLDAFAPYPAGATLRDPLVRAEDVHAQDPAVVEYIGPEAYILRGGSWLEAEARNQARSPVSADLATDDTGFRLAIPLP